MGFYEQLQGLRRQRRVKLADAARVIGMAASNLATAIQGKHDVRASTLEAIAAALDADWVLVPREHRLAVQRLLEGKGTGPDQEAKTSVELLLGPKA
ncbi:MAG: helix-turn-helix domain-containing protein [Labilithrix sp.]|nr:helix-turn-helix domain-containing protein [Labilithrix sp.]